MLQTLPIFQFFSLNIALSFQDDYGR